VLTAISAVGTSLRMSARASAPGDRPGRHFRDHPRCGALPALLMMLLGRLEILTVLVILTPLFWKS
jgi:trk system potassium uptake protein TrkH